MTERRKYILRYLPLFYNYLESAVDYISFKLKNIPAANNLINEIETAIKDRIPCCESFEQYHSIKERKYPYYRIYVKNYTIYYVVIDDEGEDKIMEVRRLLNDRQARDKYI